MSTLTPFSERLQKAFDPTRRDVISLVDELLSLCQEQGMLLDWQANQCRVRRVGEGPQAATEIPLPKSVFRAILARLAALCNEHVPNSVSPYGGKGELALRTNPPTVFRVTFTNTPSEQRFEIRRRADDEEGARDGNGSPRSA
jgi:hypothetical protein